MISHAITIGRSHRLMHQNCHDFACTGQPQPGYAFGVVLDGCGSKYHHGRQTHPAHNEVGAKLLGQFIAAYLNQHLPHIPLSDAFWAQLYQACTSFLHRLLQLFPGEELPESFTATHLLCTVVGFALTPQTAAFFWAGDGYLCHNGTITTLDSHNRPDYLAYHLSPSAGEPDGRFHTHTLPQRQDLTWLAVATDGWRPPLITQLAAPRPSLLLQRWLNCQARQRPHFEDDGAIAIWWQPPPDTASETES